MLAEARAALGAGRFREQRLPAWRRGVASALRATVLAGGLVAVAAVALVGYQAGPEFLAWWRLESAIDDAILEVQTAPERRAAAALGLEAGDIRPILQDRISQIAGSVRRGLPPGEVRFEEEGEHLHVSVRWTVPVDLGVYRHPLTFEVSRKVPTRLSVTPATP
jgi:hypothetical protein